MHHISELQGSQKVPVAGPAAGTGTPAPVPPMRSLHKGLGTLLPSFLPGLQQSQGLDSNQEMKKITMPIIQPQRKTEKTAVYLQYAAFPDS